MEIFEHVHSLQKLADRVMLPIRWKLQMLRLRLTNDEFHPSTNLDDRILYVSGSDGQCRYMDQILAEKRRLHAKTL